MLRNISLGQMRTLQPVPWPRSSVTALVKAFTALREGLATSRSYQRLRSSGASHEVAIRDAFGVSSAHPKPVHFAGRM